MTTKSKTNDAERHVDAERQVLEEAIEKAVPLMGKKQYKGVVSAAGIAFAQTVGKENAVILRRMKKLGAPSKLTNQVRVEVLRRIENGETLATIAKAMQVEIATIYAWLDKDKIFLDSYNRSKALMARTLVEKLIDETATLQNDQALAARVRADVIKWVAARYSPREFGDMKRIELSGEITHTHTHSLEEHQKRKIAESWLMSRQTDDSPGITAETTGADLEGVAVREICDDEQGIVPKRKRSAQPQLPNPGAKRGKKAKIDLDNPIDSVV